MEAKAEDAEDSRFKGVIQDMAEITGLPNEIWPSPAPLQHVSRRLHFRLDRNSFQQGRQWDENNGLRYHPNIVQAIEKLPAAHVIGQAVLTRLLSGVTTMTTIAEAACATFGSGLAELLWVIVQTLEKYMRPPHGAHEKGTYRYRWSEEITHQEHQLRVQREERNERDRRQERDRGIFRYLDGRDAKLRPILESIGKRQDEMAARLDDITRQNNELLRLLEVRTGAEQSQKTSLAPRQRYFNANSAFIGAEKSKTGTWILHSHDCHRDETMLLLDWLEIALGGHDFERLSSATYLHGYRLEDEKVKSPSTSLPSLHNCWRRKFISGNILSLMQPSFWNIQTIPNPHENTGGDARGLAYMLSPDSLALTAAALWSVFDNDLGPIPGCKCTFVVPGGAHLQCREKWEGWLIWHLATEKSDLPLCTGDRCHRNIRFSLSEEQDCVTILTTTPCILGWNVETRTQPTAPLWDVLPVSKSFKQRQLTSYTLKEFQIQAQLSAPFPVSPLIGGAATFGKTCYGIEESIDHSSLLALETAAVSTVLIYDELREVHLLCEGADVIELICTQYLRSLGILNSAMPTFNHPTPLGRLPTWYNSVFASRTGRQIPGDNLVRQATSTIFQLHEAVKAASEVSLPYWSLEEVMRGGVMHALKRPHAKTASWETVASQSPPLILAVGAIQKALMSATEEASGWPAAKRLNRFFLRFTASESSGIITDLQRMRIWVNQADLSQNMTLYRTKDTVQFGLDQENHEFILKVQKHQNGGQVNGCSIEELCDTCSSETVANCVHLVR